VFGHYSVPFRASPPRGEGRAGGLHLGSPPCGEKYDFYLRPKILPPLIWGCSTRLPRFQLLWKIACADDFAFYCAVAAASPDVLLVLLTLHCPALARKPHRFGYEAAREQRFPP